MSIKYPIKGFGAKQLYQINQSGNSGWYPIARNNFWHGGINLNFGDDDSGNKPIRAIAKGKIVAYRFTNDFFPLTKTFDDGEDKNLKYYDKKYSHNFVLIKHKHEPANSPAIEYYSLYMHLAPFKVYDSKYDKKQVSIFKRWKCKINTSKDGNGANLRNRTGVKIGVIPNGAVVTERPDPDSSEGYVNNKAKYNYIYVSSRFGDGYISEKICLDGIPGKPGVYRCKVTGASYPADKKGLNVYETPSKASEVVEIIPKGKEFYFVEPYKFISKTGAISPGMAAVKKTINGSSIGFIEVSSSTIKKVGKVIDPVLSDSVQTCDIDIAAGEIIGWPGKDGVADKNSFHFEIFTKNESIFGSNGFWKLKNDQGKPGSVYKLAKNTSFQFRKKNEPLSGKKLLENTVLELVGSPDSYGTFPKANARQVKIVKQQEGWVLKSELDWIESTGDEIGKTQYYLKGSSLKWFWKIKPASKSSKRDIYMGLRNTYNGEKVKLLLLEKGKAGTEQVRKVRYSITPVNDFNGWLANENDIAGLKYTDGGTKKRFYVKKNINSLYSSNPEHAVFKPSSNLAKNDFYILKKDCITDKDKDGNVWIGFPKESITKGDLFFDKDEYDDIDNWLWLKSDSGSIKKRNIFDWKEFFTKCSESSFSSGQDGFCDEPTLFEYIDANKDGEFGEVEIKEAVKHKTVKHKIRKLVCEHPSEWYKPSTGDMENIWGKRLKGPPTKPEEDWYKRIMKKIEAIKGSSKPPKYGFNFSEKKYKAFQEVVEKTCFLDQVDGFTANEKLWHFHP
ncbi:MAG: hypothetical protein MJE63_17425, partial [Proteobacteria bacterium]|nr:hypothetical protein [Pseudomonadota bacterium]